MNKLFTTRGQYGIKSSGKWGRLNPTERGIYERGRAEGKTLKEIQQSVIESANPSGMTLEELKREVRRLQRTVNRYANQLREYRIETNVESPALKALEESGGNISAAGNDYDKLLKEYTRANIFLSDPTHTVKGTKEFFKDIAISSDAWAIVDRLAKADPRVYASKENTYKVKEAVDIQIEKQMYSKDEIYEILLPQLDSILGEKAAKASGMHGFK